jgi:hypothetical protein
MHRRGGMSVVTIAEALTIWMFCTGLGTAFETCSRWRRPSVPLDRAFALLEACTPPVRPSRAPPRRHVLLRHGPHLREHNRAAIRVSQDQEPAPRGFVDRPHHWAWTSRCSRWWGASAED